MKRILFVEDSELLRQVFEVMLLTERDQWEVRTASNGRAALDLMRLMPFHVIASDMSMRDMDGIELLNQVGRLHPQTSRIIISGMGDQASIADALGSTHQFLVKPVAVKTLRATLVRINGLDAYLKDEKLKALAGRLGTLPSFPSLYLEIMEAVESKDSSLQTIADLVTKDPGITAKILQVANSAAHGLTERTHDPVAAIQQLGVHTVRSLVLSAHVYKSFAVTRQNNFSVNVLWGHLMKCGEIARAIMQSERADAADIEDAFTAGILHDIGKLMLAENLPDEFQNALALAAGERIPLHEAEMKIFGATHAGLAAYLLGLWGLPAPIVEAVAFHHTPETSTNPHFSPLTAVHVANALERKNGADNSSLNHAYLAKIGVTDRLNLWRRQAEKLSVEGF
jgi:HD-like signal output (HDOD) protein